MDKATPDEIKSTVAELEAEMNPPEEKPPEETKPEEPEKAEADKVEPEKEKEKEKPEPRRRAELIPAKKFHDVRHELQEEKETRKRLEAEIAELKAKKHDDGEKVTTDDLDEIAKRIATDKADPEVVKEILAAAKGLVGTKPDTSEWERRLAAVEAEKAKTEDEHRYRAEESDVLAKFPELKQYAKDLKDMAYTDGNESVPLEYLALKLRHDLNLSESTAPAETVTSPPSGEQVDYSNMTEEQFANLTDKQLEQFMKLNKLRR